MSQIRKNKSFRRINHNFYLICLLASIYKGLYREKTVYIKTHKMAINRSVRGPHRRDVLTHILSKVSYFLLKSFHFRRLEKQQIFSLTNPYILNVTQQCRCTPMLIFRAWATCVQAGVFFASAMRQGLGTANKQPTIVGLDFMSEIGLVQAAMKEVDKISKRNAYIKIILLFLPKLLFFQI